MKFHPLLNDPLTVFVIRKEVPPQPAWEDFRVAAREALAALQLELDGENAVLKPNVTSGEHIANPETGIQTHPAFVWGMADYLKDHGVKRGGVYILEDPRDSDDNNPRHWKGTGYLEVAEATGARLRCPTSFTCVKKVVPKPLAHADRSVSRLAVDKHSVLINVPKLKTHNMNITTLCMKNLMGVVNVWDRHYCGQSVGELPEAMKALDPKSRPVHEHHQEGLGKRLTDLAKVVKPQLNVVEGIVGREGSGFQHGANYPCGLVVAGTNVVAVDALTSYLMGFDPLKVIYLRIAAEAKVGCNDVSRLRVYEVRDGKPKKCTDLSTLRLQPRFIVHTGVCDDDQTYNL
jgi:uncharacterized protein (DUF362 family)